MWGVLGVAESLSVFCFVDTTQEGVGLVVALGTQEEEVGEEEAAVVEVRPEKHQQLKNWMHSLMHTMLG